MLQFHNCNKSWIKMPRDLTREVIFKRSDQDQIRTSQEMSQIRSDQLWNVQIMIWNLMCEYNHCMQSIRNKTIGILEDTIVSYHLGKYYQTTQSLNCFIGTSSESGFSLFRQTPLPTGWGLLLKINKVLNKITKGGFDKGFINIWGVQVLQNGIL